MAKKSHQKKNSSASYRLFFAVDLSSNDKKKLMTIQGSIADINATPVPPENFHITLSFLGNATERQLESILDNFQPLPINRFTIGLNDLIFWPKPAILALSIKDIDKHLLACKKQIEKQLTQNNFFSFDKKDFVPHITLFRQVESPPGKNQLYDYQITVKTISLMASEMTTHGVRYHTLEAWPLQPLSIKQQMLGD
jgi:2'-5' RNA ligase